LTAPESDELNECYHSLDLMVGLAPDI